MCKTLLTLQGLTTLECGLPDGSDRAIIPISACKGSAHMQRKNSSLDLTRGEPMKLLILFAIPMLVGSVFQLMYNMVDSAVLGRFVSKNALAAVGATQSTMSLVIMVGNAVTNGFSILISHAWGAKDKKSLHTITGHAFSIALIAGAVVAVLAIAFAEPVMRMLGTPEAIFRDSVVYLKITCGLYICQLFYNASAAILRAIGDSRTPLYFLILCSLMNVALDLLFVLAFGMGVEGVALATIISQATSAVLCSIYMWRKYEDLRFTKANIIPSGKMMKKFGSITLPMAFQNMMLSVGMMAITYVINSFGEDIVAAHTVGGKVEQLVTVIISQVAFSFSIYSGQNFGAKKYDRIGLGLKRAFVLLGVLTAISMCVLFLFGDRLALMFVQAEETKTLTAALQMIRVDASFMPMLCLIWLFNSTLRGMGHIKPTVVSSLIELCAKIGLSFLLSHFFGYVGIWFAAPIGWVIGLIPSAGYYYFGHWKQKALEADAKAAAEQGV